MTRVLACLGHLICSVVLLSACDAEPTVHKVDGAGVDFCVPKEFEVTAPEWLPANSEDVLSGFAFKGCQDTASNVSKSCGFPAAVVSGAVIPRTRYPGRRWKDIPVDAFYRQLASEPDTKIEQTDSKSIVVISNARLWDSWYVWQKEGRASSSRFNFNDEDELLVVCKNQPVETKNHPKNQIFIFCDRSVQAPQYSFNYHFEAKDRAPQNLNALDTQVQNMIDSWRCKK